MEEDQIVILRLSTGEDIICNIMKISTESYLVQDPMTLDIKYKGRNSSVLLGHWLPIEVITSNEVLIKPCDVITMFYPNKGLSEYYCNAVYDLHRVKRRRDQVENMEDTSESVDVMEALEESQYSTLH